MECALPQSSDSMIVLIFLPRVLIEKVFVLMTKRVSVALPFLTESPLSPLYSLSLLDYPAENRSDVETYLRGQFEDPALALWITSSRLEREILVQALADKSENNFMYIRYVLPELARGAYAGIDLRQLPVGLKGYYRDHWDRMGMNQTPAPLLKINLLYLLSVTRTPISRGLQTLRE
jgi:hypothetical protein